MNASAGAAAAVRGWTRAAAVGLHFRPVADSDLPFLYRVYASTRAEELAPLPWSEDQKAAFLTQQFNAQHVEYRRNHPDADWLVILRAGEAIGRLYVDRTAREYNVIDIALLPARRGAGLGGAIMRDLMDEAAAVRKPLTIYVEKFNPALRLYRRLGFQTIEDNGVYDLMRWSAGT